MGLIRAIAVAVLAISIGCEDGGKKAPSQPATSQQSTNDEVEAGQVANRKTIPFDEIWALDMPGTRPMNRLRNDGIYLSEEGPLLDEIRRSLKALQRERKQTPRTGFAVVGTGMEALRQAHAVLVNNEQPQDLLPAGSDISAVFFSHQTGRYVHLHRVSLDGTDIDIRYRFVPHFTAEVTEHFALIPLGKLPVGKYRVRMIQSPMEKQPAGWNVDEVPADEAGWTICKPFSFSVVEPGD